MREKMRPWVESLAILRSEADVSEGLFVGFIMGPSEIARESLAQVGEVLCGTYEAVWHRLDPENANVAATLAAVAEPERVVLLVHGLEEMDGEDRRRVTRSMNLSRDALSPFKSFVLFYVPEDDGDEVHDFQRVAPDLYQWRSLVATVTLREIRDDVPARWRYLEAARSRLEASVSDASGAELSVEERTNLRREFSRTAALNPRGSIELRSADRNICLLATLRQALQDHTAPVPVQVFPGMVGASQADGLLAGLSAIDGEPLDVKAETVDYWARRGDLLVIADKSNASQQAWVDRFRLAFPCNFILVVISPSEESRFDISFLLPTSPDEENHWFRKRRKELTAATALIRSLDPELAPYGAFRARAAAALADSDDPRTFDALVRSLDPGFERDLEVRVAAADSLGSALGTSGHSALEVLLPALGHDEEEVRANAVRLLGRLGDAEAAKVLLQHMDLGEDSPAYYGQGSFLDGVAEALGRICRRDPEAVVEVVKALDEEDLHYEVRFRLLDSLGSVWQASDD